MGGTKSSKTLGTIAKPAKAKRPSKSTKKREQPAGQEWWRTMSTPYLKRFADDDPTLTPGAKRNRNQHPYVAVAELDPSGRSKCKQCGESIQPKGLLRMTMMLECEKGYRFSCTLHEPCFWKHRESAKLDYDDVFVKPGVESKDKDMIKAKFDARSTEETKTVA
jgi:hypothetical protein